MEYPISGYLKASPMPPAPFDHRFHYFGVDFDDTYLLWPRLGGICCYMDSDGGLRGDF